MSVFSSMQRLARSMSSDAWSTLYAGLRGDPDAEDNNMEQLPASGIDPTGIGGRLNEAKSTDPEKALDAARRIGHGGDFGIGRVRTGKPAAPDISHITVGVPGSERLY